VSVSYKSNKGLCWLSYLSNILSPHWPKSGGSKKIFASPHFQNRGAALAKAVVSERFTYCGEKTPPLPALFSFHALLPSCPIHPSFSLSPLHASTPALFLSPIPLPLPPHLRPFPQIQLGVWGSAVSSPSKSGRSPGAKRIFMHFELKSTHLAKTRPSLHANGQF